MSCRVITVHVDGSARCAARTRLAALLAIRHEARLAGVVVPSAMADDEGAADALIASFDARCRELGLAAQSAGCRVATSFADALAYARCSDLVVVGHWNGGGRPGRLRIDLLQRFVLRVGAPVLVVPKSGPVDAVGDRVLVAWKDTAQTARAVRDAMPLLRKASRVWLVEVAENGVDGNERCTVHEAAAWIGAHGVRLHAHREIAMRPVPEQLLVRASQLGADLIVAGSYARSPLREWTFGGVSRHLLEHGTVATVHSH